MNLFKLLPFILFLFFFSCKKELETPEAFAKKILKYVAEKNETALFKYCYVNSKSEIRALFKEFSGKIDEKRVEEGYRAFQEDRYRILKNYEELEMNDFNAVQIDSIVPVISKTKKGMDSDIFLSTGFRLATTSVYLKNNGERFKVEFPMVDVNTGKWKLPDHPDITKLDK